MTIRITGIKCKYCDCDIFIDKRNKKWSDGIHSSNNKFNEKYKGWDCIHRSNPKVQGGRYGVHEPTDAFIALMNEFVNTGSVLTLDSLSDGSSET